MKKTVKILVLICFVVLSAALAAVSLSAAPLVGDVNGDGEVNIRDAATILLITTGHQDVEVFEPCYHAGFVAIDPALDATCTKEGYTAGVHCTACGESLLDRRVISASGHDEKIDVGFAPTCTATGLTDGRHCLTCGEVFAKQEVIPAAGHNPATVPGFPASCTASGLTDGSDCSVCGVILVSQNAIPATGHIAVTVPGYPASCTVSGRTDGSKCSVCETILADSAVIPATGHINSTTSYDEEKHMIACFDCKQFIEGFHEIVNGICTVCSYKSEITPEFATGFITTEKTYIETEYVIFQIEANIYVIGDLAEKTDAMCRAMEAVTGLSFKTATSEYKKVLIDVNRNGLENTESEISYYIPYAVNGRQTSSRGDQCYNYVKLDPNTLLIGNENAFLHEMAHVLRFCQAPGQFSTVLEEGWASYVEYNVLKYLEKQGDDLAYALAPSEKTIFNLKMFGSIYSQNMEFWLAQDSSYFIPYGNDNYAIGLRFLTFLNETYGESVNWITEDYYVESDHYSISAEEQIAVFKKLYGNDCFEKFYEWHRENEHRFEKEYEIGASCTNVTYDLTGFESISIYPEFNRSSNKTTLSFFSFSYNNLFINIDEARNYLKNYKNRNVDNIYIVLSDETTVNLYDKNGNIIETVCSKIIPLGDASYIKLVGSGYIGFLEICGYYKESDTYEVPKVIYSGTLKVRDAFQTGFEWNEIFCRSDLEVVIQCSSPAPGIFATSMDLDDNSRKLYYNVSEVIIDGPFRSIMISNYGENLTEFTFTITVRKK